MIWCSMFNKLWGKQIKGVQTNFEDHLALFKASQFQPSVNSKLDMKILYRESYVCSLKIILYKLTLLDWQHKISKFSQPPPPLPMCFSIRVQLTGIARQKRRFPLRVGGSYTHILYCQVPIQYIYNSCTASLQRLYKCTTPELIVQVLLIFWKGAIGS